MSTDVVTSNDTAGREARLRHLSGTRHLVVKLGSQLVPDATGRKMRAGVLGIRSTTKIGEPVPIYQALPMAADQTWRMTRSIGDGLVQLVRGQESFNR